MSDSIYFSFLKYHAIAMLVKGARTLAEVRSPFQSKAIKPHVRIIAMKAL
ncbi:MAG: hypothetical protein ACUVTD_07395 [Nitrososphaerales archaeon]